MPWLPVMVLVVFGMVSIAYMMQMPEDRTRNSPKLIRRVEQIEPEVEVVEPMPESEPVVDVVEGWNRPFPIPAAELLFEEYGNKKWTGCDPFLKGSIQDGLRKQLKNVIQVFNEINLQYALYGGTLIGALRVNGMNANEVDNDLLVPSEFKLTESIRRVFFGNALHIFKDGIYRICNIGSMVPSKRIWDDQNSQYCLYTDMYPFLPYMHCDSHIESSNNVIHITGYEKVKIADFEATMPNLLQAEQCLTARYGQWRKEYKDNSWRSKVLSKYNVPTMKKQKHVDPTLKKQKHGEHGITDKILKMIPNGKTFIEMGANDGLNSNTHYLEQLGWRGLCIEAGPSNFNKLKKNRPGCTNIQAVVSDKESTTIFREFPEGGLYGHSGLKKARSNKSWNSLIKSHPHASYIDHEVRTTTMDKIFGENTISNIDFFSLDIEGAEMSVLNKYPFKSYPVKVWAIESNKLDRKKLVQFMSNKGYSCFHFNAVNTICEYTETKHTTTHCIEEDIKDTKQTPLCRGYKYSVTHRDWMSKTFEYYNLQDLTVRFDNPTFKSPMNMISEDGGKHDPRMKVEYDYCENISPFFKKTTIHGNTMPGTTLLIFRKDDHNPFFMLSLLINALWVKQRHSIEIDRVVFLGEGIPQKIDDMFEKSLGKIVYTKDLNNAHFKNAWVLPNEYTGPLMSHLNDRDVSCVSSTVPITVNKLLSLYVRTPQENLITIISRQNYNNRKLQRVMKNEQELAKALPGVVERVQLEHMSMQEQVTQMQRSRLVIAMHGAGNVHIAWVHKGAKFIEIFPKHKRRYGYKHLAKYMGVEYREYRGGRDGPNDSKVLDIDNFMKVNNDWISLQGERNVCLSGSLAGRTGNKLVSILHALPMSGTLTLDSMWSKLYEKWLEPHDKVILYSKKKCTEKISAWDAFYKFKGGVKGKFPHHRHTRPNVELSFKLDALRKAKEILSTFEGPVATVHGRWLKGECLTRANDLNNFCTSKDIKWTTPCTYTEEFVQQHTNIPNILYCSDDEKPELRNTFKNVDQHDFNIQFALMVLSDYHFGNPQSSIDYVLTYMREKNKMYPEECYRSK